MSSGRSSNVYHLRSQASVNWWGRQFVNQAGDPRISISFSLTSLILAGVWPLFSDTVVIIGPGPCLVDT